MVLYFKHLDIIKTLVKVTKILKIYRTNLLKKPQAIKVFEP